MSPLPLPVRIAAGLVATAVEQARDLPRLVVEFPVTAVSQALQASMRVQQKLTELAIKGDRALGTLRPVEERPSWATFDDEDDDERASRNGAVTELRRIPRPEPDTIVETVVEAVVEPEAPAAEDAVPGPDVLPDVLPDYASMTIPQLRGRLRHLHVEELRALLEWETAHENRPPFVTMLSNRITTVTEA